MTTIRTPPRSSAAERRTDDAATTGPRRLRPSQAGEAPRIGRVLLLQSRWMGDVLLCTPAVRALRRAYPAARLVFAAEASGADALRGNPHLDEILVLERGWSPALRLQRAVREQRFDAVVDFRSTASTARVAALSGAHVRIGWRGRGPRNFAYTHLLPRRTRMEYVARQKLRLLAPLGVDPQASDVSLEVAVGPAEVAYAERIWREHALDGERVVALSPLSRTRHKQWGAEPWAAVGDRLAAEGVRVLLLSGPAEADQVRAVAERMRHPAACDTSARNVRELAAAYARAAVWAGNDGGLRHVAAAAGTPTVTVFRWKQTGVWSDPDPAARQVGIEEAPPNGCDERCDYCPHLACLGAVEVERVVSAVRAQLAESSAGARGGQEGGDPPVRGAGGAPGGEAR